MELEFVNGGRRIIGALVTLTPMGPMGIMMGRDLVPGENPGILPPNEVLGGFIFMCLDYLLAETNELMVFGYPADFHCRVEAITPGIPLFLYNLATSRLHGVYDAAGNGGFNFEPRYCPCFNAPRH